MNSSIRPATKADAEAINLIYNHYVLNSTATFQEQPDTMEDRELWIARHNETHPAVVVESESGEIFAWASLSPFHARSAFRFTVENSIYISPDHVGKGWGKILLGHLIQAAREMGHHQIVGLICREQEASIQLHKKFGFHHAGSISDAGYKFGRWLSLEYYQLRL